MDNINPIKPPQAPVAPVLPPKKEKVSFFKLVGDFGHYLFNRKSDVSSLSHDIVELEAERARARAEELLHRKQEELALKKDKQEKLASEYKIIVNEHDTRIKHLEKESVKPSFGITAKPEALKAVQPINVPIAPVPIPKPITNTMINVPKPIIKEQPVSMPRIGEVAKPALSAAPIAPSPKQEPTPFIPSVPVKVPMHTPTTPVDNNIKRQTELKAKKHKAAKNLLDERLKHTKLILKSKIENRAWNPYRLVQVNLIKEQRSMFFNWQHKMLSMIFFVILTILVCVLAYGYLLILAKEKQSSNLYIFTNLDNINKQIEIAKRELDETIVPFNDKLMYTGYMLDNHIYWTNFFSFLETSTLAGVYYGSGMDATINGNVQGNSGLFELWAIAKDYNTISNQTKVMSKSPTNMVLAVNISDADALSKATTTPDQVGVLPSNVGEAVKFKLKLNLDQRLFLRDK